jgi:hypothetical protein
MSMPHATGEGGPWLVPDQSADDRASRPRFFNTTGPCFPGRHYMLPAAERLLNSQLARYIGDELYWVLHAPRQTGKTTFLLSWMHEINASRYAVACYVTIETCQGIDDLLLTNRMICQAIHQSADLTLAPAAVPPMPPADQPNPVAAMLEQWAALVAPLPLVVLFDEVDVLRDQPMVSFLRQLRGGFPHRGAGRFPTSIALVGMRDLRDYLISRKTARRSIRAAPSTSRKIRRAWATFRGPTCTADRPACRREGPTVRRGRHRPDLRPDPRPAVAGQRPGQKVRLGAGSRRDAGAGDRRPRAAGQRAADPGAGGASRQPGRALKDPRVRPIIEAILIGAVDPTLAEGDDFRLCLDLGLVTLERGFPEIANPLYREVIPRVLTQGAQVAIPHPEFAWRTPDGHLDLAVLLREFQRFWRRHAEVWEGAAEYREAFPHLLLMAFLQRVLNGGGRIEREYAAGRGRVDLAIEWHGRWSLIEIKLVHPADGRDGTIAEGLTQTARYREQVGAGEAWLVVFDRRPAARARPWEERLTWEERPDPLDPARPPITVVGG